MINILTGIIIILFGYIIFKDLRHEARVGDLEEKLMSKDLAEYKQGKIEEKLVIPAKKKEEEYLDLMDMPNDQLDKIIGK